MYSAGVYVSSNVRAEPAPYAAVADTSQKDPALIVRKNRFGNALRECQRDLRKIP